MGDLKACNNENKKYKYKQSHELNIDWNYLKLFLQYYRRS